MTDMTDDQLLDYASGLGAHAAEGNASVERSAASPSTSGVPAIEVARAAADAASFKGAEDICIIDLTELSDVCDYFVLATGTSTTQVSLLPNVSSMAAVSAPRRVLVPNIWAAP